MHSLCLRLDHQLAQIETVYKVISMEIQHQSMLALPFANFPAFTVLSTELLDALSPQSVEYV